MVCGRKMKLQLDFCRSFVDVPLARSLGGTIMQETSLIPVNVF